MNTGNTETRSDRRKKNGGGGRKGLGRGSEGLIIRKRSIRLFMNNAKFEVPNVCITASNTVTERVLLFLLIEIGLKKERTTNQIRICS